jgi:hypothetical protein
LSNYAVSEQLGAELTKIGGKSNIDVSWRGPDFFASALGRHPEVVAEFPGLQLNRVSEQLEQIQQAITGDQDSGPDELTYRGPPRTADEQEHLLRFQPPAWEYLLFAGVLRQRRDALAHKWRDQELRLPSRVKTTVNEEDVTSVLASAFGRLGAIVEPMTRVFEGQQDAFGAPGEPGDPVRIAHFANWMANAYEDMLDWGTELRGVRGPEEFQLAIELAARSVDQPLLQVHNFINETVEAMERIPEHMEKTPAEREAEPLLIASTLLISVDDTLMESAIQELRVAAVLEGP